MKRSFLVGLGLAAAVLSTPALAQYNYLGYKMFPDPFKWYQDSRSQTPAGLSLVAVEGATLAAWNAWDAPACSWANFRSMGRSTAVPIPDARDSTDGYSVSAIWVSSSSDPYYNFALAGGQAIAASIPLTYAGGLYQCDIYLNAFDYAWSTSTPTPAGSFDVQTVLMREIGHCLGLGDNLGNVDYVMYPSVSPGQQKRALHAEDVNQLCSYYPANGYGSPCNPAASTCVAPYQCKQPPLPDGGVGSAYCMAGCAYVDGAANPCAPPFVCKSSTLMPGFSGACLPSYGAETAVGRACTAQAQCGSVDAVCILENNPAPLPSGFPQWQGGYCSQDCSAGKPPCPSGSTCYNTPAGSRCLKTCRPGSAECRTGYACSPMAGLDAGVGACVSACHHDADCGSDGTQSCRTCDGICQAKKVASAEIGDSCATAAECGIGQACLKFWWSTVGVCSQPCGAACNACPSGSACLPAGSDGEGYCLKSCGVGTCAAGQQCGLVGTGQGCIPACSNDLACPSGYRCSFGQCVSSTSVADGGSCLLCFEGGQGNPPGPGGGADGGITDPPTGGCGCQGAGGALALALPLLAGLLLTAGRRRSWPRQ